MSKIVLEVLRDVLDRATSVCEPVSTIPLPMPRRLAIIAYGSACLLGSCHAPPPTTSYLGPYFSYPYTETGRTDPLLMDATVHVRLQQLFEGLTPTTKVRGAVYVWRFQDFGPNQEHMTASPGAPVSSPKEFTEVLAAQLARSGTTDAGFIIDTHYMDEGTREALVRLKIPFVEDKNSDDHDGIMHCKFFTFSELRFANPLPYYPAAMDHVVAVTSANINNSMYQSANNLVIMHGNPELYDTMVGLWDYIRANPRATKGAATSRLAGDVFVYSFPREEDTIVQILTKVLVRMVPFGPHPPRIRLAMALFTPRRSAVRDLLAVLAMLGADVQVVLSHARGGDHDDHVDLDRFFGGRRVGSRLLPNDEGVMHSKYLLVDASYELQGHVARRQIVWTGSHNYTRPALTANDEVLVRIVDQGVYAKYLEDWNCLWELAGW